MNTTNALSERGLKPIPSELIEPYLKAMISVELEFIEYYKTEESLTKAKNNLKGVEEFVSRFCGIHSRYAVSNVYENFYTMTLEQALSIIKSANKEMYG